MVKLNKIYTRTGDDGTTGLALGGRVRKDSARVEAYGAVDEANAAVGIALGQCREGKQDLGTLVSELTQIQHDLFDVGADLATPVTPGAPGEAEGKRLRILPSQTTRLERQIDAHNARLAPLTSFVLPGGSPEAAALHLARTLVRRAERDAVRLLQAEAAATNPEVVRYLNRLSDYLFVVARVANDHGKSDVLWVPGATRGA